MMFDIKAHETPNTFNEKPFLVHKDSVMKIAFEVHDILQNTGKNNAFWNINSPYTHKGLDSGKIYYYRVAVWDGSEIRLSKEVSAKPK